MEEFSHGDPTRRETGYGEQLHLTILRDPQHGLVTATSLGLVTDARDYNTFAELRSYVADWNGSEILRVEIPDPAGHDALGRIVEKREWVNGEATPDIYTYAYDDAGRLWQVRKNGLLSAQYTYDANGNRLTAPGLIGSSGGRACDEDRRKCGNELRIRCARQSTDRCAAHWHGYRVPH